MAWLVYENSDENTQLFVGIMIMAIMTISFIVVGCDWIYKKFKKKKNV